VSSETGLPIHRKISVDELKRNFLSSTILSDDKKTISDDLIILGRSVPVEIQNGRRAPQTNVY